MNSLLIGSHKDFSDFLQGDCLFLHDQLPAIPDWRRPVVFHPARHHINPVLNVDYHYAVSFVEAIDAVFSRGESTLTKDTGLDFILQALLSKPTSLQTLIPEPGKKSTPGHIWAYNKVNRILLSPTLRRVFDPKRPQFNFNRSGIFLVHINRAELVEFDALFLGLILMSVYRAQLVVPDLGFYGRNVHTNLIRQKRLIAGLNYLDEVPVPLRRALLSIKDIHASGVQYDDAVLLAKHAGLKPDPSRTILGNDYDDAIDAAMSVDGHIFAMQ
jgi:hypothetical protein